VVGSSLGAQVALSLSEEQLRQVYMISLVAIGGRSFVAAIRNAARLRAAAVAARAGAKRPPSS
jgi:uncharacterized membrane protein YfcA